MLANCGQWRVFYIDVHGILQESIGVTSTENFPTKWVQGEFA